MAERNYPWSHGGATFWLQRKRDYERTNNPLLAWTTIIEALEGSEALPDWARDYLTRSGRALMAVNAQLVRTPSLSPETPEMVAEALGFTRKGQAFREYEGLNEAAIVGGIARGFIEGAGMKPHAVFKAFSGHLRMSLSKVRRLYLSRRD